MMDKLQDETLGLFELNDTGTVIYSSVEYANGSLAVDVEDQNGRDFFTEVATFTNVEELRRRLEVFKADLVPARSFDFVCQYEFGPIPVRVLLARLGQQIDGQPHSFLIHLKRSQAAVAHA